MFSLQSVLIFSILKHPPSLSVYYYLFRVCPPWETIISRLPSILKEIFIVRVSKFRGVAPLMQTGCMFLNTGVATKLTLEDQSQIPGPSRRVRAGQQ